MGLAARSRLPISMRRSVDSIGTISLRVQRFDYYVARESFIAPGSRADVGACREATGSRIALGLLEFQ